MREKNEAGIIMNYGDFKNFEHTQEKKNVALFCRSHLMR